MKIIQQQNWVFTLYEDEHGQFVLDVLFPAKKGAWASYEESSPKVAVNSL